MEPTTKFCTKCKNEKTLDKFHKHKDGRLGLAARCKVCRNSHTQEEHKANPEKMRKRSREWRKKNLKKAKRGQQEWYKVNRKAAQKNNQKWQKENTEKIKIIAQNWRKKNPEYNREWRKKNLEKHRKNCREYMQQRRETDPNFRLNHNMRGAIGASLKGDKNGRHWETLVGYTLNDLKKHLKKQFTKDMTWENYGKNGWVIDHKIPISAFNFTEINHTDFKKCWALKNLQPMWAVANMKKHAKLTEHFQPSLLI